MTAINLTSQRFGRLTAIERAENRGRKTAWVCLCDCGNKTIVTTTALRTGNTVSCGCFLSERITKHGQAGSKLYKTWNNMISRCYCKSVPRYKNYGERGIKVCDEWKASFEAFYSWAVSNGYAEGLTLDRIDNDGNYCPENCRWVTNKEQQLNKSNNRLLTFDGETKTVKEWADTQGLHQRTLGLRIDRGWDIGSALTKPVQQRTVAK